MMGRRQDKTHITQQGAAKSAASSSLATQKNKVKPLVLSMQKLLNVLTLDKAEKIHTHRHTHTKDTHRQKYTPGLVLWLYA